MHLDVQDLRNFYYRSALGRAAQKSLRGRMLQLWPEAKGQTVAGYGFAVPLLRPYLQDARRVMALMPGPQGVMPWPAGQHNVSALIEETMWPIETGHVDKLVVMHGLETSDRPQDLLEECWRVLGPGARRCLSYPTAQGCGRDATAHPSATDDPIRPRSWKPNCANISFCPNAMSVHSTSFHQADAYG